MANLADDFWEEENRRLRKVLTPLIRAAALSGAEWALDNLGELAVEVDWRLINKAVYAWAKKYGAELVDGITNTSRQFVSEQLVTWIESGQPLDNLIDALTPMFGEVRASMIGVTEVTRSFAEGNIATWRESSWVTGKQWMTGRDELVCEICEPLDGQIVELNSDGFTTEIDDEAIGLFAPPAHVNCRCYLQPFVTVE
jgi:SPP1 gp7 family putative phage head morphogenesis protein